ncbi:hypothetical protein DTO027B5_6561 [Paecilomyces variotii]|nr:hypothetical protein DTO169C6_9250 [Paecilomyces variotii]KAJ9250469.1 hypothetical protein DTO207G8_6042 [Paecilomyces variotii]KAJ9261603.1 hypothetical protein DTO195F2_4133 [Paecilomyces variotii]KAJ9325180.1 hypothetical protein DTO027B3_3659 [Paecilomyces variotii]KAJ9331741.1 hypothetical protein DTO027B5_6561 [Paecilomyces variotii]
MRDEDSNRLAISYNQALDVEKSAEQPSVSSNTSNQPPSQITFDGPDDPENPHNWGIWKKAYTTSIPGLMGLAVTFGSSVYSPSYAEVAERFQISNTVALLPITLYTYGLACGPVIAAPLSETYGRRFIYIFCMPLSLMFTLGAGLSQNLASLLICRLLAGILGSPPLAVGAGTNLDIWAPIHRARAVSLFLVAPFLGPALGPAVGGYVAEFKGWRWTQWTTIFLGAAVWIYSLGAKETYAKIILAKRLKKLGKPLPRSPIPEGLPAIKFLLTVTLARPIHMILTEPIVGLYSLYVGFNFSVLFCFFAAFPLVFRGLYRFSVGEAGLVFLGLSAGCAAAAAIFLIIDDFAYIRRVLRNRAAGGDGTIAPENRLYGAMLGSVLLTVGLFWFAWTARADIHWISCVIATVFFACGNLLTFTSCALYLTDVYGPLNGASAMAANGIVRYMLGGSFPLFTVQMYEKLGIDWATSLLAFVSLALLPVPWLFFKYGSLIRKKSGYDVAYP